MESTSHFKVGSTQLGSDHTRPVPMGISIKIPTERGFGISLAVLEVLRGGPARERIGTDGAAVTPLAAGFEYVLVKLGMGYYCKAKGSPDTKASYPIANDSFQASTADGRVHYDPAEVVNPPYQAMSGQWIPVHETREGWTVFALPEALKDPLLVFHRRHAHSNYVLANTWRPSWFQLSAPDPMQLQDDCGECRP